MLPSCAEGPNTLPINPVMQIGIANKIRKPRQFDLSRCKSFLISTRSILFSQLVASQLQKDIGQSRLLYHRVIDWNRYVKEFPKTVRRMSVVAG